MPDVRLTQSAIEILFTTTPDVLASQSAIELILGLGISCGNPPAGVQGTAYTRTFTAGAGDPPYVYSMSAGIAGLTLDSVTGILSGIPTGSGVYAFTLTVTDTMGASASVPCSITIAPAASANIRITLRGVRRLQKGPEPEAREDAPECKPREGRVR